MYPYSYPYSDPNSDTPTLILLYPESPKVLRLRPPLLLLKSYSPPFPYPRCVILSITKENFEKFFKEAPEAIADFEVKLARYGVSLCVMRFDA